MKFKQLLKRLFCLHQKATEIGYYAECDKAIDRYGRSVTILYSVRVYRCDNCGKIIKIDGRNDPYAK